MENSVIALDVGGSSVKSGTVNLNDWSVTSIREDGLDTSASADHIFTSLADTIHVQLNEARVDKSANVALSFPGPMEYETGISRITGLAKFEEILGQNVKTGIQSKLPVMVNILMRNDAEAAVVGEAIFGAGKGSDRLLGVTLGTGIGSCFVQNGQPVLSHPGIPPNGWVNESLFLSDRADDTFSTRGLIERLGRAGFTGYSVEDAATVAMEGNALIMEVFEQFGRDLGAFLGPFASAFEADLILLLGGIAKSVDLFSSIVSDGAKVPTLPGVLSTSAPLLGAALLFDERDD